MHNSRNLYSRVWRWHLLAALLVIPFVLWQSITGILYLWSEWWMDVQHPELRFVSVGAESTLPSIQINAAAAAAARISQLFTAAPKLEHHSINSTVNAVAEPVATSALRIQEVHLPASPARSTIVFFQSANGLPLPVFVDPYTGQVLGHLSPNAWLPGLSRALHGGWPLGKPGSWLLELADGWTIVMVCTGLYLWWPRGRSLRAALTPRYRDGTRVLVRDLHAIVAVTFSLVLLFFLVSALPWTAFWGGELLSRLQVVTEQESPAGFSFGGATADEFLSTSAALDSAVFAARERQSEGTLHLRLDPGAAADIFVAANGIGSPENRYLRASRTRGSITIDVREHDLPGIPRAIEFGVHIHQGDFGAANKVLNTALAAALLWLTATGVASWWMRRPRGSTGVPIAHPLRWSKTILSLIAFFAVSMPLFALSLIVVGSIGRLPSTDTAPPTPH